MRSCLKQGKRCEPTPEIVLMWLWHGHAQTHTYAHTHTHKDYCEHKKYQSYNKHINIIIFDKEKYNNIFACSYNYSVYVLINES